MCADSVANIGSSTRITHIWGIHLTDVRFAPYANLLGDSGRRVVGACAPGSVRWRALHARRMAASRRRLTWCRQTFWVGDELAVANGVVINGELQDAVEHQATAAGAPPVEP